MSTIVTIVKGDKIAQIPVALWDDMIEEYSESMEPEGYCEGATPENKEEFTNMVSKLEEN